MALVNTAHNLTHHDKPSERRSGHKALSKRWRTQTDTEKSKPWLNSTSTDPAAPASPGARQRPAPRFPLVLEGQAALVTGANSGIGKAVALGLGASGADVVVNYVTNPEAAEEVAHQIEAGGRRAHCHQGRRQPGGRRPGDVRQGDRPFRNAPYCRQQRRAAARCALARYDAEAVEQGHLGQPYRAVPVRARSRARIQEARRGARDIRRRRQARLHELGSSGDSLGRPRQLRRLEGRRDAVDAKHRAGSGATCHSRQCGRAGRHPHADQRPAWETPEAYRI